MARRKDNLLLFRALGEETKFKILELLLSGEYCACEIPSMIGRTQSNTSMHLSKLQKWGIIRSRRHGKMIIYTIKDGKVSSIFKLLGHKEATGWRKVKVCAQ